MIAGIVLAAGRSTRMGEPKALLRLDGLTFLERAVATLREGGCARVHVVVGDDPAVARETRRAGAELTFSRAPNAEQIDSLRCALRALPGEVTAALVLPVDVPGADAATVRRLIQAHLDTGAPLALPAREGRHGHPVLFARALWGELLGEELPDGARGVVHAHAADRVEVPVDELPADVDTPEDYRRLLGNAG